MKSCSFTEYKGIIVKLTTSAWRMAYYGSQYFNYLVKMSV